MAYKLTQSDSILRKADGAIVPIDYRNVDYQEYRRWLAEGNTPDLPDSPLQPSPQSLIDIIETETKMNRAVREGMLLLIEREAMREFNVDLVTAQSGLYAGNPAYKRIKDIDNQIIALRAQI